MKWEVVFPVKRPYLESHFCTKCSSNKCNGLSYAQARKLLETLYKINLSNLRLQKDLVSWREKI